MSNQVLAAPVTLPADTFTVHDVRFSDPLGNADTHGGDAYDRQTDEIGVNKGQTNSAAATITPARAASRVAFISGAPTIATVSPAQASHSPQALTISGITHGSTQIFPQRRTSRKLGAFVFTPFQRTVAFHIINDNAGHNAGLTVAQGQAIVQVTNNVWSSQANITFPAALNPQVDIVPVSRNFSPCANITSIISGDEQAIVSAAKNTNASINVYFIFGVCSDGSAVDGVTRAATGDSYVSVQSLDINRTTEHEIGHALGLASVLGLSDYTDAARIYQLMYGVAGGGFTITPAQVNFINPVP